MRPCISCGQPRQIKVFCISCYLRANPLVRTIKLVSYTQCQKCKRIMVQNAFVAVSVDKYIEKVLPDRLKLNTELERPSIESHVVYDFHNRPHSAEFRVRGRIDSMPVSETYSIPVQRSQTVCNDCRKMRPDYYEAILQLRDANSAQIEKAHKLIGAQKFRRHLNRHEAYSSGGDFYFSKTNAAKQAARVLRQKIGGQITTSRRVYSKDPQTSRTMYRLTILFRPVAGQSG